MAWTTSRTPASWLGKLRSLFGQPPVHEAAGRGRRSLAWMPGNPGAVAAMLATSNELRGKSRDLVRRNAWAQAGIEASVYAIDLPEVQDFIKEFIPGFAMTLDQISR